MNYELIVSDFDETLANMEHHVPQDVVDAINEYEAAGGIFAVCTGRMLKSILPRVREIGLKGIVVAYQGTVIADIETGEMIHHGGLTCEQTVYAARILEEYGLRMNAYSGDVFYSNVAEDNPYRMYYQQSTGMYGITIEGLMSDFVAAHNLFCEKITVMVTNADQKRVYEIMRDRLADRFDITCSAGCLVEVSPLNDHKGTALKWLADHYGIPMEKTIACGDQLNDLTMIEAAGLGVAVGNAVQQIKDAADVITDTNDNGGVGKIIREYGLKKA
ncbi:MAG: Cof-type HAD-IIB family hydrolase [Clostridia bacterium]|nr:Cof-type HAD-IIB family hydrolase [Clostridia bacterium]